ncbi:TonB-dependent receptor [Formosa sediminum]|uniref:TonB-dependent receptor n=1 Tax=Formosa sediminum TaxID=2594004 RepID=A0A516GUW8_9FLAO|nr:TonB-dependent receptor [Formosa sediminum]QDO95180.1 TonB-dependent receptor [Formosa sediminum]
MKKTLFKMICLLLFGLVIPVQAQEKNIEGTLVDTEGTPLAGATITIKGTAKGVASDFDGNFSINASPGNVLVFSFLGYTTKEVKISTQTTLKVVLESNISELEETVIIGYGSVRKEDLTGSVSVINEDDFNQGPAVGVENLIQGRASGVQISTTSAEPGADMLVRIRGNNSVNSNNNPLYVVDGFPMESLSNSINPADIESVSILKDASATAIYGTRGANGVVIITTKRGKQGKSSIIYTGSFSIQNADIDAYDFIDSADYALLQNQIDISNGISPSYTDEAIARIEELGLQTNWLDEAFRTGYTSDHQLAVSGGNDDTKMFFSLGAYSWDGVVKNTSFDRYNLRLNADQDLLDDRIKVGVNTSFSATESDFLGFSASSLQDNILRGIFQTSPLTPTYDVYDELSVEDKALIFGNSSPTDPLETLEIMDNSGTNYFMLANAFLEATILKDFTFKTQGGARIVNQKISQFLPSYSSLVASSLEPGSATQSHLLYKYYTYSNLLSYDKLIGKHSINAVAGYSHEWSSEEYFSAGSSDFTTDALGYYSLQSGATILTPSSYIAESELASYLARVNYIYDDRYLLTLTYRRDGSSKFGEGNKWGNFPAGAVAWNVHNEDFFNSNFISQLKLRTSIGITGNDRFGVGLGQSTFSPSASVTTDGSTLSIGTISSRVGNEDLQWEETKKFDLALEVGFFDNSLTMELGYYKNNTTNLLLDKTIAPSNGIESILTNSGEVENKGYELSLNYNKTFNSGFSWSSTLNFSQNENTVIDLDLIEGTDFLPGEEARIDGNVSGSYSVLKEGLPVGTIYGYRYLGVLQQGETSETQPTAVAGDPLFADLNGDGQITGEDKELIGNGYAKYNLGFSNTFSYKNITLSVFLTGVFDIDKLNGNNVIGYQYNTLDIAKERWTPENTAGTLPQDLWQGDQWVNDYFVEDASYVRLKNVSLSYDFSREVLDKIGLASLQLSLIGTNLATWDTYSGFDPEVNSTRSSSTNLNTEAGLDAYSYPYQKSFTLGVKVGI